MDPATIMIISSILGAAGNAASGSGQQQVYSFDGTGADPESRMAQTYKLMEGLGGAMAKQQAGGYNLPDAVVQTPQGFSGHGLPMNIGLGNLHDPAINHPEYLHKDGLDLPSDFFSSAPGTSGPTGARGQALDQTTHNGHTFTTSPGHMPYDIWRRGQSLANRGTMPDDSQQALTALRALR